MKLQWIFVLIVFTVEVVLKFGVRSSAVAANLGDEADYEDYEETTKRGRAASGYRSTGGGGMCPPLTLANGRVRLRSRGRIAKFLCRIGFQEMGKRYATCIRGHWNARPPICISRGCPTFASPTNGRMSMEYRGALLNFDCNPGFALVGSRSLYCDGRQWNSTAPNCEVAVKNPLKFCDFEWEELCGWSQDSSHNFDWKRFNFVTPSGHVGTGPSHDHTLGVGRDGFYMYIEASSPRVENDTARLFSPVYPVGSSENACFRFWYHMYGATTGQIRVYVKPVSKEFSSLSPRFVVSGDQGNQWLEGLVHITHLNEPFQVIVEGVRGSSYVSDSAIDDVELTTESECNIGTTLSVSSDDSDTISDPTAQSMPFATDLEASTSTWMGATALHTLANNDTRDAANVTQEATNVMGTSERAIVKAQFDDDTSGIFEDLTTTTASVGTSTQNTESHSWTSMTPHSTSLYSTSTTKAVNGVTFVASSTSAPSSPPSVEPSSPPSTARESISTMSTVVTIAPTTTVTMTPIRITAISTTAKRITTATKKSTTTPSSPKATATTRPTSRVSTSTEAVKGSSIYNTSPATATRSPTTTTTATTTRAKRTTRPAPETTTRPTTPSAPRSTSRPTVRSTTAPSTTASSTTAPSTPTFNFTKATNVSTANDTSKSNLWTTMATTQPSMTTMLKTTKSSTTMPRTVVVDSGTTEAVIMAITTGTSSSKNDESNILNILPDETDIVDVPTIKNKDRRPPPWTYMKRPIMGTDDDDDVDFGSDDNVAGRNEIASAAEARTAGDQVSFPTIIGLVTVGLLSMVVVAIVARKFYRRNRYGQEVLNEDSDVRYLKDGEVRVEFSDLHTTYFSGKDIESDTL